MPVPRGEAPSLERLRAALLYCPETGIFTNLIKRHKAYVGVVAGWVANGRVRICLDGETYLAHRLAWFYVTGDWPFEVDHADTDGENNRWDNLRLCTHGQNLCNRRMAKHNKCGFKGVHEHQGRFRARIVKNRRLVRSGMFATPEEAHAAYARWAREIHGEFARVK